MRRQDLLRFDGTIAGASFSSGDTIVAGCWWASPFGAFADVMWARPDGTRVLLGPDRPELDFVWSHYWFEERAVAPVRVRMTGRFIRVTAGPLSFEMLPGPAGAISWLLRLRPRILRTWEPWSRLEDGAFRPILSPLIGGSAVRLRGSTRAGVWERYTVHDLRPARRVRASLNGLDLGRVARPHIPARFGFSEFPSRPGAVRVTSIFEQPARPWPVLEVGTR